MTAIWHKDHRIGKQLGTRLRRMELVRGSRDQDSRSGGHLRGLRDKDRRSARKKENGDE